MMFKPVTNSSSVSALGVSIRFVSGMDDEIDARSYILLKREHVKDLL